MSAPINWKQQFVDLVVVILGILIAFGLGSWNDKRQARKQANILLEGIKIELQENKESLSKTLPYHQELLKTLRETPEQANLSLNPASVSDVSWQLAQTNVFKENIDPLIYRDLAQLYQRHEFLNLQVLAAGERMSEINVIGPFYTLGKEPKTDQQRRDFQLQILSGWIPIFESWVASEKMYLQSIERVTEKINRNE